MELFEGVDVHRTVNMAFYSGGVTPFSPGRNIRTFKGTCRPLIQASRLLHLAGCLAYFTTMKMETIYRYETLINFYQSLRLHIPEERFRIREF
jgi:hypothetical protein